MDHVISEDALARGLEYVRRNGSELMGALAAHATGLASDGDMEGVLSTISQTWQGLQWLLWTCPSDSAPLDRTVDFLRRTQHVGGYWDEPPGILEFNPPPWMVPGNHANQLWLTSAVCCKLLELGRQADVRFEAAL